MRALLRTMNGSQAAKGSQAKPSVYVWDTETLQGPGGGDTPIVSTAATVVAPPSEDKATWEQLSECQCVLQRALTALHCTALHYLSDMSRRSHWAWRAVTVSSAHWTSRERSTTVYSRQGEVRSQL